MIFKRAKSEENGGFGTFVLFKRHIIKGDDDFNHFSMQFYFKSNSDSTHTCITFAKKDKIFDFNYMTAELHDICVFPKMLNRQPDFFMMNTEQTVSIIASIDDGIYYNHKRNQLVDLESLYNIGNICEIIHDCEEKCFYMLVNKYQEKLGIHLIQFDEEDPCSYKFFLTFFNKLDIGNANINIIKNVEKGYKELLISYKTIYMNTYTVQVIDISSSDQWTVFKHISFQMWETNISGFYVKRNKDFITINNQGINVIALGN